MTKLCMKWGLAGALALVALGSAIQSANAATISFSARVYSLEGREGGVVPTYSLEGVPPGLGFEHETLAVNYQVSGLPYYVSNVTYQANGVTKFLSVAGVPITDPLPPGSEYAQPVTIPSRSSPGGGSEPPAALATLVPGTNVYGNKVVQAFALDEFKEGTNNSELTYVRIDGHAGEMKGVKYGHNLFPFDGSTVTITFTPIPGAPLVYKTIVLTAAFGIQSTPDYATDKGYGNFGSTGGNIEVQSVPEPGSLATLLGIGVAGSAFLFRRRRSI